MRSAHRADRVIDGILLLDKPSGLSSNAALQRARRAFGAHKAGHGGSLDPFATGMLPVCFGQATKVCGSLLGATKFYRASIRLGASTDTGDVEGAISGTRAVPALSEESVDATLARFVGERMQLPPMYSAVKSGGRRLYEFARRGEVVDRAPRRIVIHELDRVALAPDLLEIDVRCSKGTYVRTLGEEIAAALGTLGHLVALRRIAVAPFEAASMVELSRVEALARDDPAMLERLLLPADAALVQLPRVDLDAAAAAAMLHGRSARVRGAPSGCVRIYGSGGRFLGLADAHDDGSLTVRRLFVTDASQRV